MSMRRPALRSPGISIDSRRNDAITDAAGKAGGTIDPDPPQDHGFMYGRSFEDPDGHHWEPMWMDPAMAEHGPPDMQPVAAATAL